MRWAHENGDRDLARDLFDRGEGATGAWVRLLGVDLAGPDAGEVSPELTHREALDLAWVLDVLRGHG